MHCLILTALCFLLADATYSDKNRFQRLLNRYQKRNTGDLFGSDDVDDHIQEYLDEIRCQRKWGDDEQCQRGGFESGMDVESQGEDFRGNTEFDGGDGEIYGQEDLEFGNQGSWSSEMQSTSGNYLSKEVEKANVKLTTKLYQQCKEEKDDKNIVVSPLSVQLALAALNYATAGNTKRQISRVLCGRLQNQESSKTIRNLVRRLKGFRQSEHGTGITTIKPVTGIFVASTIRTQTQQMNNNLGATIKQCNFQTKPQQCRQMINEWMSQKTNRKITRIVPQDAITDNTKMILVNGLELKAKWGPQMLKHQTKEAKFYPLGTNKAKIVEVMETQGRFKYCEDELVKIVGIPTQQKEMTLFIIVPKLKDGLIKVEKLHLQDGDQLKQLLDTCVQKRLQKVHVQLPKFQIKHKVDVRRTLRKQGVTAVFDPQRADFSRLTGVNQNQMDENDEIYDKQWMRDRRNPFLNKFNKDSMFQDDEFQGDTEKKLHLNKFIHQTTIKITDQGITATTEAGSDQDDQFGSRSGRYGRQWTQDEGVTGGWDQDEDTDGKFGGEWEQGSRGFGGMTELDNSDEFTGLGSMTGNGATKVVKANHAFAFVLKHNPTKQVVLVGRVIDAAQKKINYLPQTIDTVDQL